MGAGEVGGKAWLLTQGLVATERNVSGKQKCRWKTGFLFKMLLRRLKQKK